MKRLIANLKDIDEQWKILTSSIIIIVSFGVLPSYWVNDWEWFSRGGALLVVYGIYIVWRDIKGKIHSDLDLLDSAASEKLGEKSAEFTDLVKASPEWQGLLKSSNVKLSNIPEADHTFSQKKWRDQVFTWTREWIQSW